MRTLSQRVLNRALLARQLLLERADLPLAAALEQVGGLQAQYAPSMYIGLWSRVRGFRRDDLTTALEQRAVVQATLQRQTIHLVSRGDYWAFALAVRDARRVLWRRAEPSAPDEASMIEAAERLRAVLADGPRRAAEVDALLGKPAARGVGLWLDLVRVPPSGTWARRRADLYGLAEDWLGPAAVDPVAARRLLVRRYLEGFGPATRKDVASWSGIGLAALEPTLERLELRRYRSEGGEELVDWPGAPLPEPDTAAPVRFLPTWDANLLVHARRTGVLPEQHRPLVFSVKRPQSVPTFLVDGAVAGSWRYQAGRIELTPFEPLRPHARDELEAEGEGLATLHA